MTCVVCKRKGKQYGTIGKLRFDSQLCMRVWIAGHPEKDEGPE